MKTSLTGLGYPNNRLVEFTGMRDSFRTINLEEKCAGFGFFIQNIDNLRGECTRNVRRLAVK